MPSIEDLNPISVPPEFQPFVDRLRKYLKDTAALNVLEQEKESTDLELYCYLQDALNDINVAYGHRTNYLMSDAFPTWSILQMGAVIQVLISVGIYSSRNTLSTRDSGGVVVSDFDKYGRYMAWYNILINKFRQEVTTAKRNANIEGCYGGVWSEYSYTNSNLDSNLTY